jgi:hypothetical protein
MAAALEGRPSTLLRSTTLDWATRIPEKIAALNGLSEPMVIDLTDAAAAADVGEPMAAASQGD